MHLRETNSRIIIYNVTGLIARKNITKSTQLYKLTIRYNWSIEVSIVALNCMQMQAIVHKTQTAGKSCSIATAADHIQ